MPSNAFLGEFEQMILLAVLQGGEDANAFEVRKELEASAGRTVTKGAFYTTLDRLERKKYVTWTTRVAAERRGGMPQRHFKVTTAGIRELRKSHDALVNLWRDEVLEPR